MVDQRHGGPIVIRFNRYAPGHWLEKTLTVDNVMVVREARLSVT